VTNGDTQTLIGFFNTESRTAGASTQGSVRSNALVDPDFLLRVYRILRRKAGCRVPWRSGRRLAIVDLPVEQHSRCAPAQPGQRGQLTNHATLGKCSGCWRTRAQTTRSSTISPPSG
jgi:hypothetical protein